MNVKSEKLISQRIFNIFKNFKLHVVSKYMKHIPAKFQGLMICFEWLSPKIINIFLWALTWTNKRNVEFYEKKTAEKSVEFCEKNRRKKYGILRLVVIPG